MYQGAPQPQPGQKHTMTRPVGDPLPQHQVTKPVGNNIQVVPKPQVPVSRDPVNVIAANLSNEPPAITKSYTHAFVAKENPRPVEPQLWNNNGPALQPPVIPVTPAPADKKKYSRDQLMELKNMASIEFSEKCRIPMDIISAGAPTGFRHVLWPRSGGVSANMANFNTGSIDVDKFKALAHDCMDMKLRPMMPSFMNMSSGTTGASGFKRTQIEARVNFSMSSPAPPAPLTQKNSFSVLSMPELTMPGLMNSSLGASGSSGRCKTQGSVPMSSPAPPGPQEPTQPPPVVDNKARSTSASDVNRTPPPQISKQVPFTPMQTEPVFLKNNNSAFEKLLAADKDVNYYIEKKYLEFLTYGEHFTDKQDFKIGNNNQYMEEVNNLTARCLNHLNEPMLSVHRLEKLYIGFVDKIEEEVNSLGKDKFDARGLTRSLLLDLLAKRPADHIFVSALLISIIQKHKKWGSCVELLKDFQIFCTKSDIRKDYPNVIKVIGDIFGYLICFGSFSLDDYKKILLMKYVESVSSTVFVQMVRCIARLKGPDFLFECFSSEESLKEYLSPLFYRKYKSSTEFDTLDLKGKLQDKLKLGFLLDGNLSCHHSLQSFRVKFLENHPGLVNICLLYYVSNPPDNSSSADYLSLNFPMSSPAVAADVYFALTQKICYESLEPQVSGDEEVVTYKLNDAKFKELYRTRLVSTLQSLDVVLPSLYSILDVNLYNMQRSQFVIVKELLNNSKLDSGLLTANSPFNDFQVDYFINHSEIPRVLCRELFA